MSAITSIQWFVASALCATGDCGDRPVAAPIKAPILNWVAVPELGGRLQGGRAVRLASRRRGFTNGLGRPSAVAGHWLMTMPGCNVGWSNRGNADERSARFACGRGALASSTHTIVVGGEGEDNASTDSHESHSSSFHGGEDESCGLPPRRSVS